MRIRAILATCVLLPHMLHAQTARPEINQTVTVTTDAGPDNRIPSNYYMDCVNHLNAHSDSADSIALCKKAADEADTLDPKSHFVLRRAEYCYYASALMQDQQYMDALAVAEKAVAVVLLGHDDASGSSAAYGTRGAAKAYSHDLSGADRDFETAEEFERKGLATTAQTSDFLKGEYTKTLKGLLNFHAQILVAMGSQDAADLKLAEANKL